MRKLVLFSSMALVPLLACTAILGDFTVGGGGGDGGDAGDAIANPDAPLPDGGGDADAAPPLKLLNCTLNANRVSFTFDATGTTMVSDGDRVTVYPINAANRYRLIITSYNGFYYTEFSDNDSTDVLQRFNVGPNANILSSTRYGTPGAGGTIFLVYDTGGLSTVRFDDTTMTPVAGVQLLPPNSFVPNTQNGNRVLGTLDVVNASPTTNEYYFAIEYTIDGQSYQLDMGHAVNGPTTYPLPKIAAGLPSDIPQYALVHDSSHLWLVVSPPGSGGPPSGPATIYQIDPANMAQAQSRQVFPPGDAGFYLPFAFSASGNIGHVDLSVLSADLSQQTVLPNFTATSIPMPNIMTFDPATLPVVPLPLSNLAVNKGTSHWLPFPNEDEFIAVARPIQDGVPGMDIDWFDSLGRPRVLLTTDGGGNFPNTLINTADVTFSGQPTAAFAQMEVAWIEGQQQANAPPVRAASATCTSF